MKVFIITDNKWWLDQARKLFKIENLEVEFYCSPKGRELFAEEIDRQIIKPLNIKESVKYLIDTFDLGFSLHCKQIFPAELVKSVRCINVHPGLNPYNRGWFPQVFSIINKKPAGATIHLMDEEVDHGEIIVQKEVEIYEWDTSKTIYDRILSMELELLEARLESILREQYVSTSMIEKGNYNGIEDYNSLLEVDLTQELTMKEAIDYLRALTHPPYKNAYFLTESGEKVYLSLSLEKI